MKRNILFAIIALVLVVAMVFTYLYLKKTPDVVGDRPAHVTTAAELIAAFTSDTAAARRTYIDKVVEVTGTVKSIDSASAVVLGNEGSPSVVVLGLDRRHLDDYKKLTVGDMAVMQGVCTGYEKAGGSEDPTDLLAALGGVTIQFRSAGVKSN